MERAFARRALSASLIVAVAFVAVWGGRSVLWCPAMERAVRQCCCPAEDSPVPDSPAVSRAACCETKVFEAAPASGVDARSPSVEVAAPLLVAVLSPRPAVPPLSLGVRSVAPGRGGLAPPKTPVHLRNCVHLL